LLWNSFPIVVKDFFLCEHTLLGCNKDTKKKAGGGMMNCKENKNWQFVVHFGNFFGRFFSHMPLEEEEPPSHLKE
jgi:hypothetical protein